MVYYGEGYCGPTHALYFCYLELSACVGLLKYTSKLRSSTVALGNVNVYSSTLIVYFTHLCYWALEQSPSPSPALIQSGIDLATPCKKLSL